MEKQDVKNWLRLNLLLDAACSSFRKLFLETWKTQFGKEWNPSDSSVILENKQLQNTQKFQRKIIQKGDVNLWDITTLRIVLTAKGLLNLLREQIRRIHRIAEKRNYLAHHPTKFISEEQFNTLWDEITNTLVHFGETKNKLNQLRETNLKNNHDLMSVNSLSEAARLEQEGMDCFNDGDYSRAIKIFTEGLDLPGLLAPIQAVLFEERCAAYLELCSVKNYNKDHLQKGREDAERIIELWPDWWKGHMRLGQIYSITEEFEKAVRSFNDALTRGSQNVVVTTALNKLFKKSSNKTPETLVVQYELDRWNYKILLNGYFQTRIFLENIESKDLTDELSLLKEFVSKPLEFDYKLYPGFAEAEFTIGVCYAEGVGVIRDMDEAISWFHKSSQHECLNAANILGLIYELGKVDGKADLESAEKFFKLAAIQCLISDCNAIANLAFLYEEKGDWERALEWCDLARANGSTHPLLDELKRWLVDKMKSFFASDVVEWEKRYNKDISGLTLEERKERYYSAVEPLWSYVIRNIWENVLRTDAATTTKNKIRFIPRRSSPRDIETSYSRHSIWPVKLQSLPVMYRMLKLMEDSGTPYLIASKSVVEHFLARAQEEIIDHFQYMSDHQIVSVLSQLIKLKTPHTEILQAAMASSLVRLEPALALQRINDCIQNNPQNYYLYDIRGEIKSVNDDHLGAVQDSNLAVILNPYEDELLFNLAKRMQVAMHTSSTFKPLQVLEAYQQFIELADVGHSKTPDAFCGIARVKLDMLLDDMHRNMDKLDRTEWEKRIAEMQRYSKLSTKTRSLNVIPYSLSNSIQREALENEILKIQSNYNSLYRKHQLNDAERVALIHDHRKTEKRFRESLQKDPREAPRLMHAIQSETYHAKQLPPFLETFKPITFHELGATQLNKVYEGRSLAVTVIDVIAYVPGIPRGLDLVIEDENGDIAGCFVQDTRMYTFMGGKTYFSFELLSNYNDYPTGFSHGQKLIILNPLVRKPFWHTFGKLEVLLLYSTGSTEIIPDGFEKNLCRYCCKSNASLTCTKCTTAKYCNQQCRRLDWTKLKHSLSCHGSV